MTSDAIKDGARQFVAGGAAGLVEVSFMHPLDLIKTRLQVGHNDKGMLDCVRKTFKNEGFLGFYKSLSMAGLFCGFTEAVVINPFEVVKVRLQAERGVSLMEQKSAATMAREIAKSDGMGTNGLYRGMIDFCIVFSGNAPEVFVRLTFR
uniref:Mitochondrial 2-oxodicarboxylate carrier n=1 Tax=Angiostrongylus cantonensis TaxID=6313 RepID=A0A0K0D6C7_ANGCA